MILKARVPYMVQFYDLDYSSGIVNPCSIIIKVGGLKMLFNGTSNSHVYVQNGRLKLLFLKLRDKLLLEANFDSVTVEVSVMALLLVVCMNKNMR